MDLPQSKLLDGKANFGHKGHDSSLDNDPLAFEKEKEARLFLNSISLVLNNIDVILAGR